MASVSSATMVIASPRISVVCQARRPAPLSFHPKLATLARDEGRSMLPAGIGSLADRPGTLPGRPVRGERPFGGGGFSKTLQLQRNRRRAALRKYGARAARQPEVGTVLDEAPKQPGYLEGLVNNLLFRAASRLERGTSTCIRCQGKGTCDCPVCKGRGVLQPDRAQRKNSVTQTVNKIRSLVGADTKLYDKEWLMTNRCSRCRGLGKIPCLACGGQGVRGVPSPVSPGTQAVPARRKSE